MNNKQESEINYMICSFNVAGLSFFKKIGVKIKSAYILIKWKIKKKKRNKGHKGVVYQVTENNIKLDYTSVVGIFDSYKKAVECAKNYNQANNNNLLERSVTAMIINRENDFNPQIGHYYWRPGIDNDLKEISKKELYNYL